MYQKKVYVLVNPDNNRIKIGVTENIQQRIDTLRNASGCDIFLFYLSPWVCDAYLLEAETHKRFARNRYIGEWFDLEPEKAVIYIQQHLKDYQTYNDCDFFLLKSEDYHNQMIREGIERIYKKEESYEEKVLDEPLTRFKSIGKNIYVRKNTELYYQIRYSNKQWLIKRIRK